MPRSLPLLFGSTLTALLSATPARAAGPPSLGQTYPRDAVLVSVGDAATLQQSLDDNGSVRLEPGDYSDGPPIVLRTGQKLYGLRSTLPEVTVEPGSSGIVLSNARLSGGLKFPPSSAVTRHNLFFEVSGRITVDGATLEENTLLGLENGSINIDTSAGGWLRNNRFIRIRAHHLMPLLTMAGDAAQQSYGNVFLWGNQLTQPGAMVVVSGQRDVTFLGWDDEAYADPTPDPIYSFQNVETLRLWTMGGRSPTMSHPLFDIQATEAQLTSVSMGGPYPTPIVLGPSVERVFAFNSREPLGDQNPSGMRLSGTSRVGNNSGSPLTDHGNLVTSALPQATADALTGLYTKQTGEPWERPTFHPIADPAGPNWDQDLASKPDSTATLQQRIDTEETVLLDPGIYYISSPLQFRDGTKIIGSGAGVTAIVAKDPSIDMLVDDGTTVGLRHRNQILDITLQGGTNGVHLYGPPGEHRQYTEFLFSNVVFRKFSNAGFFIDQIFGLDNGVFHQVDFVDCGTGFKQYVDPDAAPGGANSGYMDKVMFYGNQFVGNGVGAELLASRANNLNSFVNSLFRNNSAGALIAKNNNDLQLVNSDLINNGGAPSVQGVADVISCYFRADEMGVAMLKNGRVEGSRFERGSSTTGKIFEQPDDPFFAPNNAWANYSFNYVVNSSADDIDVGNVEFGIFLNSDLPSRPDLSKPAAMVWVGDVTPLASGSVTPRAQLLVGVSYAEADAGDADGGAGGDGGNGGDAGSGSAGTSSGASGGATAPGGEGDGGCGCTVPRRSNNPPWLLALGGLVVLALARRATGVRRVCGDRSSTGTRCG